VLNTSDKGIVGVASRKHLMSSSCSTVVGLRITPPIHSGAPQYTKSGTLSPGPVSLFRSIAECRGWTSMVEK
jgi:hypothetical protein